MLWHKKYPKEVSPVVEVDRYSSIPQLIDETVKNYQDKKAFTNMDVSLTYNEMGRLSDSFANFLTHELGLKKGDSIALQMPNLLQFPVALFGSLKAGLVVVNTNPLYTEREMLHQFKDSGVKAIVILANFASQLENILDQTQIRHVIVTEIGDLFPTFKRILVNKAVKYIKKNGSRVLAPQSLVF